ncbi:MAG: LuxR C-terminal-related transcriptional regulator [Paracoccaceae bacterium]|jgi:DNA-binding CsgD family transcriptional regulator|nr:LuxR C-terminal-related transcriptional regulator [Paracoccaceae bacterium]
MQTSTDDRWAVACEGLADIGFHEVSWGHVDPATDPPSGKPVRSTLPLSLWDAQYRDSHFKADPLVAFLLANDTPFVDHYQWHDLAKVPDEVRELALLIMDSCYPARFAVAERALGHTKVGILSLASDVAVDRWTDHVAENVQRMTLVARLCAAYLAGAEPPPLPQPLSLREVQSLELLGQWHRNDRIAERLGLHRATVDMHIVRAPTKLGARTREQAIARAVAAGAICP